MGTGTGKECERCGLQIYYDDHDYDLEKELCGHCVREIKKKKWDKEHKEED